MRDLVDFAARHDLWLLCDEVYDEMVLSDGCVHTAAAPLDCDGRVITVCSFSKVYAMTGWRVGYVAAPAAVADLLRKLQEPLVSCPSTISQKAAEAALTGPREPYDEMLAAYRRRRAVALDTAASAGVRAVASDGTLYMLLDVSASGVDDLDFALGLLESHSVSVAPGSVFGPAGRGWARISLAAESEVIAEGCAGWQRSSTNDPTTTEGHGGMSSTQASGGMAERVRAYLDGREDEVLELARDLIRTPSPNPPATSGPWPTWPSGGFGNSVSTTSAGSAPTRPGPTCWPG